MSITGAMNTALTGLAAASRGAATVSNNLANAMTDGFARRELELTTRGDTGGVGINGDVRIVDRTLLTDRRSADGEVAFGEAQVDFLSAIQSMIGEPGSPGSLSDLVAAFEGGLVAAAAEPSSGALLEQTLGQLDRLTERIGETAASVQLERGRADTAIADAVTQLNADLSRLETLNEDIRRASMGGGDAGGLLDQRQRLIDRVSELVPVREMDRGGGRIALLTDGGILMDGPAPVIGFQATGTVTEFHSLAAGTLSGLTVDGAPIDLGRDRHLLSGGRLEGLFVVRDALAPMAQDRLDGFARDLLERFQQPGVDPSVAPGGAGLLTDAGAAFAAPNETGLSRRLAVNALADPDQGGAAWRLRDGLGMITPGDVGQAAGLHRLGEALSGLRDPVSGGFTPGVRTSADLAADVLSAIGMARDTLEGATAHASARASALAGALLENGVDSDAEMQRLLLIEQAYAANARVISASQAMLDMLMEI